MGEGEEEVVVGNMAMVEAVVVVPISEVTLFHCRQSRISRSRLGRADKVDPTDPGVGNAKLVRIGTMIRFLSITDALESAANQRSLQRKISDLNLKVAKAAAVERARQISMQVLAVNQFAGVEPVERAAQRCMGLATAVPRLQMLMVLLESAQLISSDRHQGRAELGTKEGILLLPVVVVEEVAGFTIH